MNDATPALVLIFVIFMMGIGWIMNVWKLTQADFASPYKTEVIRTAGVIAVPLGGIVGWMTIGEENE